MDFTITIYNKLIQILLRQGFSFHMFSDFVAKPDKKIILVLHDVDASPANSLLFARIQADIGIRGSYYFRIVPESYDQSIVEEIHSLGHEIGYHYEDVSLTAGRKMKGRWGDGEKGRGSNEYENYEKYLAGVAIESFAKNLEKLRKIVPVKTICMHGSPMSKWDNRLLWKYYDYLDFEIVGEPYFDVNLEEVLYLTDTGRRWDGGAVSIRDKAQGTGRSAQGADPYKDWKVKPIPGSLMNMTQKSIDFQNKYKFKSTSEIIRAVEMGELPNKLMMTFHPQRWTDKLVPWMTELIWQNVKNVGKYFLIKLGT
jgi:hypothetical protein